MIDYALRADSEADLLLALAAAGLTAMDEGGQTVPVTASHDHALDVIGTLTTPGEYDAEGNVLVAPAPLPGYHANLRLLRGALPAALAPLVVEASARGFAGGHHPPPTLAARRAAVIDAIYARKRQAEAAGLTLEGLRVATDRESIAMLTAVALDVTLHPERTTRWKAGGAWVDLTAAQVLGIADAVRQHVQACFDREGELVAAVQAAEEPEAVDIDAGWPA